jgi:hypothetical protein
MSHGLSGEELERAYRKSRGERPTSTSEDDSAAEKTEQVPKAERGPEQPSSTDKRAPSTEQRRGVGRERPRESRRPEHDRKARALKRALRALDRLREAKHRREVAEEETDAPQSTMNRILWGPPKGGDVGICEACETKVEEARQEYREAVQRLREVQEADETT